jgi:hypothetical protein
MTNQIVTIRFSIPDSWEADSFAVTLGECFAELNPDDSELVSIIGAKVEPKVHTFHVGQRYTRKGK